MTSQQLRRKILADTHGLSDNPKMFQLRTYLTASTEPLARYEELRKVIKIDSIVERALIIEMKRLGFNEFSKLNEKES